MKNRILVVDDTQDIRENLRDMLLMEGYHVTTAANGLDALNQLEKELPDLIITDLVMPTMDGFMFIKELKKQARLKRIRILVFSAKPIMEGSQERRNLEADLFLPKAQHSRGYIKWYSKIN